VVPRNNRDMPTVDAFRFRITNIALHMAALVMLVSSKGVQLGSQMRSEF